MEKVSTYDSNLEIKSKKVPKNGKKIMKMNFKKLHAQKI